MILLSLERDSMDAAKECVRELRWSPVGTNAAALLIVSDDITTKKDMVAKFQFMLVGTYLVWSFER
jgi:hypothetical protein